MLGSAAILIVVATVAMDPRRRDPGHVDARRRRDFDRAVDRPRRLGIAVATGPADVTNSVDGAGLGSGRTGRKHRSIGFTSFYLMLVHTGSPSATRGATRSDRCVHELWQMVTVYQGMLLAVAGTVALFMVVVTSIRAAPPHAIRILAPAPSVRVPRRRSCAPAPTVDGCRLHRLDGSDGLLVGPLDSGRRCRADVPGRSTAGPQRVPRYSGAERDPRGSRRGVGGDDWSRVHRIGLQAGQFCQWRFLAGRGWMRAHPFSISAVPRQDRLRITAKFLGDGSTGLAALSPGTRVFFEGP